LILMLALALTLALQLTLKFSLALQLRLELLLCVVVVVFWWHPGATLRKPRRKFFALAHKRALKSSAFAAFRAGVLRRGVSILRRRYFARALMAPATVKTFQDSCAAEDVAKQMQIAGRVRPGDSRHLYVNLSRA
jgi:hypothetical protein